jgi:hypothetical protein
MKLENGNLLLSTDEIALLSLAKNEQVDAQYPVEEFIGSMASIKEEAEEYIRETQAKPDCTEHDLLKIGVVRLLIEVCEMLSERAYATVQDAGYTIKWQ